MPLQVDPQYVADVLQKLTSNPTSQDMDYLVEAYTTIGWYAATVQGAAELAESERKYAAAEAYAKNKGSNPKATQAELEALATITTREFIRAEIKSKTNAMKMKNLWLSIEQTINAIKHLEKNTSSAVRMG